MLERYPRTAARTVLGGCPSIRSQAAAGSCDVTPSGWSGSSESLVAHVVGRKAYHDDDEETAYTGAGGPQTHPSRSAAGRGQGRRRRLPGAAGVRADLLPVAEPVRRVEGRRRQETQGLGAGEQHAEAAACGRGAGEGGTEGDCLGKLLGPARRRAAVHHLITTMGVSERFACVRVRPHMSFSVRPDV